MEKKEKGTFRSRPLDRAVFAILAMSHVLAGLYLVGPWYLDQGANFTSPLFSMFNNKEAVSAFGWVIFVDGLGLLWGAFGKGRFYTRILTNSLMVGFLLRLYGLLGTFVILESWRPPSYLANVALVSIFGAYWVAVKVNARPTG